MFKENRYVKATGKWLVKSIGLIHWRIVVFTGQNVGDNNTQLFAQLWGELRSDSPAYLRDCTIFFIQLNNVNTFRK